jgi:hypothetical protein
MGLTFSAPLTEDSLSTNEVQNMKRLANVNITDNNILDTLNMSEFNLNSKEQMPLVGGNEYASESDFAYNVTQQQTYRKEERYNDYDLFNIMTNLEAKNNIVGGNLNEDELNQSSSSNNGMDAIKSIILEEINNYKKNKLNSESDNIVGGGDCGCSGENKVLEGGKKKKNNKSKSKSKSKKVMKGGISSSSSESSYNNYRSNKNDISNASSNEDEEKGLSIFPLNSSDISNQTSSERNFRMLRRKM